MKILTFEQQAHNRRQHNKEILNKMYKGESLTSFDSQKSWFPPRPIVKKDSNDIKKLYGNKRQHKPLLGLSDNSHSNLLFLRG